MGTRRSRAGGGGRKTEREKGVYIHCGQGNLWPMTRRKWDEARRRIKPSLY